MHGLREGERKRERESVRVGRSRLGVDLRRSWQERAICRFRVRLLWSSLQEDLKQKQIERNIQTAADDLGALFSLMDQRALVFCSPRFLSGSMNSFQAV